MPGRSSSGRRSSRSLFAVIVVHFSAETGTSTQLSFIRDDGDQARGRSSTCGRSSSSRRPPTRVNLTDGLDGLASGSSIFVLSAYMFIAFWQFRHACDSGRPSRVLPDRPGRQLDTAIVAAAMMGAVAGFLWWNAAPARIFMGDTGALALGGLFGALAITHNTQLLLVDPRRAVRDRDDVGDPAGDLVPGFGRRIFRMSPIHHHFELAGWPEFTVIVRFWIIAGLCVAVGIGLFYADFIAEGVRDERRIRGRARGRGRRRASQGAAAAEALAARGRRRARERASARATRSTSHTVPRLGVDVAAGGHDPSHLDGATLVVTSPASRRTRRSYLGARRRLPVWSELELGARLCAFPTWPSPGRTARRRRPGSSRRACAPPATTRVACGNIGHPFPRAAREGHDVLVVEASSFQLRFAETFHPRVSVLLNLAPDHLDWHGSSRPTPRRSAHLRAPGRGDTHVGNRDDPRRRRRVARGDVPGRGSDAAGAGTTARSATSKARWCRASREAIARSRRRRARRVPGGRSRGGRRPVAFGVAADDRARHRGLHARSASRRGRRGLDGVRFVDDSKATNVHAALAALEGVRDAVLIAGGRAKGADLSPLRDRADRLTGVVAIGEAAREVGAVFDGLVPVRYAATIEEAAAEAFALAPRPGRCSSRRPARAGTCSATTRNGATASPQPRARCRRSGMADRATGGRRRRRQDAPRRRTHLRGPEQTRSRRRSCTSSVRPSGVRRRTRRSPLERA